MKYKITQIEYDKIEHLSHCAISAYSKNEAKPYLEQLAFFANSGGLVGSVGNIINDLCCSVMNAAGNVADKSRKTYFVEMDLFKLKNYVEE